VRRPGLQVSQQQPHQRCPHAATPNESTHPRKVTHAGQPQLAQRCHQPCQPVRVVDAARAVVVAGQQLKQHLQHGRGREPACARAWRHVRVPQDMQARWQRCTPAAATAAHVSGSSTPAERHAPVLIPQQRQRSRQPLRQQRLSQISKAVGVQQACERVIQPLPAGHTGTVWWAGCVGAGGCNSPIAAQRACAWSPPASTRSWITSCEHASPPPDQTHTHTHTWRRSAARACTARQAPWRTRHQAPWQCPAAPCVKGTTA
jgi:hypothetical protein